MEKTLTIDGQQVNFKSTAATPMRYKAQFGSDFFADLMKMAPMIEAAESGGEDMSLEALRTIDFEVFYNMIWTLAKTADNTIPEPIEWLDGFDVFPLMEIIPELQGLMMSSFGTNVKKKTHLAANPVSR